MALKKAKAATAANKKAETASKRKSRAEAIPAQSWIWSRGPLSVCAMHATSHMWPPPPIKEMTPTEHSTNEDAEGEDEPEPGMYFWFVYCFMRIEPVQ